MTQVVFDPATWKARYPEFASVTDPLSLLYFDEATLYVSNADCSVVPYDPANGITTRATILNMVTAHVAKLNATIGGIAPTGGVGRVAKASEGSVSVDLDYGQQAAQAAFWLQTPYGAAYWQATARFRRGRYIPGPQRYAQGRYGRF